MAHFSKQEQSGLTIKGYCEKHSLSLSTFYSWRKYYGRTKPLKSLRRSSFRDIGVIDMGMSTGICDVRFPHGVTISVHPRARREDLDVIFGLVRELR